MKKFSIRVLIIVVALIGVVMLALVSCKPPEVETTPLQTPTISTGDLQIEVTDLYGQPLPGAKAVSGEQPSGQLKLTGLTDTNGTVLFSGIKSGNYVFTVSVADYVPAEINVPVQGGQVNKITVNLAKTVYAPDDILFTPGGPSYRANHQQAGVTNPWPPIEMTTVTLANPRYPAKITYRDYIETAPGETRNNIFYVILPDVDPSERNLPVLDVSLQVVNLPPGITAVQTDMQWHGSGPTRRCVTPMVIAISDEVKAGEYVFNIDVVLNGVDYGSLLCKLKVTP
jgi:hypothetical protein